MKRGKQQIFGVVLCLLTGGIQGCDKKPTSEQLFQSRRVKDAAVGPDLSKLTPDGVELLDGNLREQQIAPVTGSDMRPYWLVSGRIRTYPGWSAFGIKSVKIRITMLNKSGDELDGQDIEVKADVPPGGVRGFTQQIRLLPPATGSVQWTWKVLEVEPQ